MPVGFAKFPKSHRPQIPVPIIPCGGGKRMAVNEVQMIPPVCIPLTLSVSHYIFAESGPGCLVGGKW